MVRLLPQWPRDNERYYSFGGGMLLAFDPSKSPHYKVFHAVTMYDADIHDSFFQIQTYSSQTGNWSVSVARINPDACLWDFYNGIYWNNAIHWLVREDGQILHHKFDVDHQVFSTIQTHVTLDGKVDCDCQLFESRGFLFFVTKFDTDHVPKLNIYGMRNEDSVWSVKYIVNLDEVGIFPKIWSIAASFWASFGVMSIILGEKEDDSFLVMVLYDKVVRYNLVSQTVSTLSDFVSNAPPKSFQLIASFARV